MLLEDGAWSDWADVGSCSTTCGDGQKTQQRTCDNPAPNNGGLDCPDDDTQTVNCNLGDCPLSVDGNWCPWQNTIGECPITCGGTGGGLMPQIRSCGCPAKANGGADCVGDGTRNSDCGTDPCPGRDFTNDIKDTLKMDQRIDCVL